MSVRCRQQSSRGHVLAPDTERAVAAWEKVKAIWSRKFGPNRLACLHPGSSEEMLEGVK